MTVAQRLTERLAVAFEERGDYLDPDLAASLEALFWSRNAPPGTRDLPRLVGMEAGGEEEGLRGKALCAVVAGFSLHAGQCVAAHDREALERLCRYGLRAPFSQERLSRRADGKVVYRLRRPWPHAGGHTHLVLEPHDFLRRLAALVSFPRSHSVRRHGVFANRSRWRKRLPSPPPSRFPEELETLPLANAGAEIEEKAAIDTESVTAEAGTARCGKSGPVASACRRRVPWARLLHRVLSIDALACPRCSTRERRVPMTVLAFLTDPEVVGKILHHLGLPTSAPALASAKEPSPRAPPSRPPP